MLKFLFSKEYKEIYLLIIILVIIRIFIFEPFRIPSGSMEPTLLIGDFIFVNKFIYGIKIPFKKNKVKIKNPEKGDIIVFKKDKDNYIKRLIGKEDEKINYKRKYIYINKKKIKKKFKYKEYYINKNNQLFELTYLKEYLNPKKEYIIKINKNIESKYKYNNIIIPNKSYFVLGDNRDNSEDSRYWGFVPEDKIKGKAIIIWFSFDIKKMDIRWNRILKKIK